MLWELINRLSHTNLVIRINGENGVGKEMIARLISSHYPDIQAKFVKFDCRQLINASNALMISDLANILASPMGHVLYFENIESTPKDIQERLLELLNTEYLHSPPWIIVSNEQPLELFATDKQFSTPLFEALNTIHITLSSLRSTPEKIPQILAWFINHYSREKSLGQLTAPSFKEIERLSDYKWPGNIRQLQNTVLRAVENGNWNISLEENESNCNRSTIIDDVAAVHILSVAKLSIHRGSVMEELLTVAGQTKTGLLDLAILFEAISQISSHANPEDKNEPDKTG